MRGQLPGRRWDCSASGIARKSRQPLISQDSRTKHLHDEDHHRQVGTYHDGPHRVRRRPVGTLATAAHRSGRSALWGSSRVSRIACPAGLGGGVGRDWLGSGQTSEDYCRGCCHNLCGGCGDPVGVPVQAQPTCTLPRQKVLPGQLRDRERLAVVRATGLLDTGPEQVFEDLAGLAARVTASGRAFITLVDETRSFWKACVGVDAARTFDVVAVAEGLRPPPRGPRPAGGDRPRGRARP